MKFHSIFYLSSWNIYLTGDYMWTIETRLQFSPSYSKGKKNPAWHFVKHLLHTSWLSSWSALPALCGFPCAWTGALICLAHLSDDTCIIGSGLRDLIPRNFRRGMWDFGTVVDTTGRGRRKAKGGGILSTVRAAAPLNIASWRMATSWNTAASATLHATDARAATSTQGSDSRAGDGRRRPWQRIRSPAAMSTLRRRCGVQIQPSRPCGAFFFLVKDMRGVLLISRCLLDIIIRHRYLLHTEIAGGRTSQSRPFITYVWTAEISFSCQVWSFINSRDRDMVSFALLFIDTRRTGPTLYPHLE
jgi:hypothetical protein